MTDPRQARIHQVETDDLAPQILRGDFLVCEATQEYLGAGVYALELGGQVVLRRVTRRTSGLHRLTGGGEDRLVAPDWLEERLLAKGGLHCAMYAPHGQHN
jgi:hypothetical protein